MADEHIPALVIDNGSGFCKAGISGDDAPRASIPTVVGRPKQPGLMVGMDQKDTYVGDEVNSKMGVLNLSYPINHGMINNWEDMEKIWSHLFFNEMHVTPDEHPVLMTEAPNNKKKNRETITEMMFEKYQVPQFYLAIQQVMALFASGLTTGIVIDSGYSVTHTVPIYEGFALSHAIMKINLAGRDLTEYLIKLVEESGKHVSNSKENEVDFAREIKEKYCWIASEDFEAEMKNFENSSNKDIVCTLPDGNEIHLASQLFKCPEALFSPIKMQKDFQGIHELTFQSIMKCDVDIRKDLYGHMVLAGGSTMFKNLHERLLKEISALAPSTMPKNMESPPERKNSVWIGASILSSLASFQPMFITKAEYTEGGASFVNKKCF